MGQVHRKVKSLSPLASAIIAGAVWFFPITSTAQQAHSLQLSAGVSFQDPSSQIGLQHFVGYGLTLLFSPSDRLAVGLSAEFAKPSIEYDVVGGTATEDLRLYSISFAFDFRAIDDTGIRLDLRTRLGLTTVSSDDRTVSVGGFGFVTIPGQNDRNFAWHIGPVVSHEFISRLSLFVSPELVFVSPVQFNHAGYSVEGGLAIGIL